LNKKSGEAGVRRRRGAEKDEKSDRPLLPGKERITKNTQWRPRRPSRPPDRPGASEEVSCDKRQLEKEELKKLRG